MKHDMCIFLSICLFQFLTIACVHADEGGSSVTGTINSHGMSQVPDHPPPALSSLSITDTTGLDGRGKLLVDTLNTQRFESSRSYIIIDKTNRTLSYFKNDQEVFRFPVAFGSRPGQKRRRGDRRTPEGEYRIIAKHEASKFHKFLWLNYPNGDDARRGRDAGLISERDYEAIIRAVENDTIPPQNTRLGGDIGIHGGTAVRIYRKILFLDDDYDWTLGCIAAKNEHIDQLYDRVEVGTRVLIMEREE